MGWIYNYAIAVYKLFVDRSRGNFSEIKSTFSFAIKTFYPEKLKIDNFGEYSSTTYGTVNILYIYHRNHKIRSIREFDCIC